MDYLEIIDGQGRRRHVKLEQPRLLIGREASCDICLPHPNVSRRHAQLQRTDQGRWLLQDLNSLNHIYFIDAPVQQIILEPGKQVRIGEFRLALSEPVPPPGETPPATAALPDDSSPSWPGLEPGWLEHLQRFQRLLLRLDEPRPVPEKLAEEFMRIAQPH